LTASQKANNSVTPAKAGVQNKPKELDSRFRGNDGNMTFHMFYDAIIIPIFRYSIIPMGVLIGLIDHLRPSTKRQVF
jgi:hypothetical protein